MKNDFLKFLSKTSYSKEGLWKSCLIILLIGTVTAWGVDLLWGNLPETEAARALDMELEMTIYHVLVEHERNGFQAFSFPGSPPDTALDEMSLMRLGAAMYANGSDDTRREIEERGQEGLQGAYFLLGRYELSHENYAEAFFYLRKEYLAHPHVLLRHHLLEIGRSGNLFEELETLRQDPEFQKLMRGGFDLRQGILRRDWGMILRNFWVSEYSNLRLSVLFLALLTGGIWGVIFLHIYPEGRLRSMWPYLLAAFILGGVSTWPTVWSGILTDQMLGMQAGDDFFSTLLYHTMSVGFREELCKMLLFLPLLFPLRKSGDEVDALLFGTMVGLGFATEENLNYFDTILTGGVTFGRFVSANFLHCLLSGICGLAVYRLFLSPSRWLSDSLLTIAMAIGLHGLYNTLLSVEVPGLGDMAFFSGTVIGVAAILYFRELKSRVSITMRKVSITGVFFWGFCLLLSLDLLTTATVISFREALVLVGEAGLATVITGVLLLSQLQEPIGD